MLFVGMQLKHPIKKNNLVNKIKITVKDTNRQFSFTNKKFGQYYGLTNAYFNDGWQGWTLKEQRIFNDYKILINGTPLPRNKAVTTVYPYILKRDYPNINESLFFADSINLLVVKLTGIKRKYVTVQLPGLTRNNNYLLANNILRYDIDNQIKNNSLFISSNSNVTDPKFHNNIFQFSLTGSDTVKIAFYVNNNSDGLKKILDNTSELVQEKESRIENVLERSFVKTNDKNFDKALLWTKASIDALITTQQTKGIFAGLPWFNNYWGRDTFISLPGATFLTGDYQDAKEILLDFAKHQEKDSTSPYYGRIPNRITLKETIYNTTDGTPWFIIQAYNYYKYSNDFEFLSKIYPAVKLALKGALKNYVDKKGFLTHRDAETWMDAVGPNGPWSPRGNRADDIQALWDRQLKASAAIGKLMKDQKFVQGCEILENKVKNNFQKFYLNSQKNIVFDRLKTNGTPDSTIRPNLFFDLNDKDLIPSPETRFKILARALKNLVYPYGVLSLSQNNENFHPYHHYEPYYVQDAAYHNGIIWVWNYGPVIKTLTSFGLQDSAWELTSALTQQILDRGAVGTLCEVTDALPRPGEKEVRLSGAYSQAWSIAEYIQNFYQDYLGVEVNAPQNQITLSPHLPDGLKKIEFKQKVGNDLLTIDYNYGSEYLYIKVEGNRIFKKMEILFSIENKDKIKFNLSAYLNNKDILSLRVPAYSSDLSQIILKINNDHLSKQVSISRPNKEISDLEKQIHFAVPVLNKNLKALKGPGYLLLKNSNIKMHNPKAKILFNVDDKINDEQYEYPTNPNFVRGILDLKNFTLSEDTNNYYFKLTYRNLHNPGWHLQYGYQLTFTSICIRNDSNTNTSLDVGVNSKYLLAKNRAFNRKIDIGGGFDIKDASGKTIAAYLPADSDVKNPLGNVDKKMIYFSIPKKLLGSITKNSVISILVGAQDDHGGAGIGEFREVNAKASEWHGGGKMNPDVNNIYDFLFIN